MNRNQRELGHKTQMRKSQIKQAQEAQEKNQQQQENKANQLQQQSPQGQNAPNIFKDGLYLFWVSFVMGLTVFGGGYAMLPVLERAFSVRKKFVTKEDMLDILALSQSVPGLISVNALIMIGYRRAGIFGAIMGVLGLAIPSIVIICVVTIAYTQFITNKYIGYALVGIRAGVIGLLVSAVWSLASKGIVDKVTLAIAVGALALAIIMEFQILSIHPIIIILSGLVVGFTAKSLDNYYKGKKGKSQQDDNIVDNIGDVATQEDDMNTAPISTLVPSATPLDPIASSELAETDTVSSGTLSHATAPSATPLGNKEGDK